MTKTNNAYSYRELEAAIDIAINAGSMLRNGEIETEDSREFVEHIVELAGEYERKFGIPDGEFDDDYITRIDKFANRELKHAFGKYQELAGTRIVTYRYIRVTLDDDCVLGTSGDASFIGMYITDESGLPQNIADIDMKMEELIRASGATIESAEGKSSA